MMKNTVFVLGSIQAYVFKNPGFRVRDLIAAMELFNPTCVLTAARATHSLVADACIDCGVEQALIYAFAEENRIPLHAIDAFDDVYLEDVAGARGPSGADEVRRLKALVVEYQRAIQEDSFTSLQSPSMQNRVRHVHELAYGPELIARRHEAMWQEITRVLKADEKSASEPSLAPAAGAVLASASEIASGAGVERVLVVVPLDLKYGLDARFVAHGEFEVVRAETLFSSQDLRSTPISRAVLQQTQRHLLSARSELKQRLTRNAYRGAAKDRLALRMKEFDLWITRLAEM